MTRTVTVEAGITYGQLCPQLDQQGFALHNLASLPHISVAGGCATGTHGSGVTNGNLSSAVSALEIVTASGDVLRVSRDTEPDIFHGAVVNLGALGVVDQGDAGCAADVCDAAGRLSRPADGASQRALRGHCQGGLQREPVHGLAAGSGERSLGEAARRGNGATLAVVDSFYGARPATVNVHPIVELSAENCTEQMGVVGPWYERLPHFRMGFTPSSGKELQTEYLVARRQRR